MFRTQVISMTKSEARRATIKNHLDICGLPFQFFDALDGGRGYVCTVPIVTTTANESTLHPDHVIWHEEARDTGLGWFSRLHPMLIERLANYELGESAQ